MKQTILKMKNQYFKKNERQKQYKVIKIILTNLFIFKNITYLFILLKLDSTHFSILKIIKLIKKIHFPKIHRISIQDLIKQMFRKI